MAASRCFQRVLELEPDNSQAQQEVSWPQFDRAWSDNLDMIIHYQISFGQASANKVKRPDTERFKRRSTRVTANSHWESQEANFGLLSAAAYTDLVLQALHRREASGGCKAINWLLQVLHIVTEYHKFLCQVKNAESILEYERMAEIGFEKRDFRMVSYTVISSLLNFVNCVVFHQEQNFQATQTASVLWFSVGCFLHGPCLGVCLSLSQVQDTEGRVLSPAGTLPWGSVCCQVRQHIWKILGDSLICLT